VEFGGGTIRAAKKPPFFLVPIELLEAVAETRLHGDRKYKPGNWMQGDREFFVDCLSHAIKHLIDAPWDNDEDFYTHLGHAACNIAFILWARRRGKISHEDYQNAAAILTAQQGATTDPDHIPEVGNMVLRVSAGERDEVTCPHTDAGRQGLRRAR